MTELSQLLSARVPEGVKTICRVLSDHGYRAWIVGGCVRDIILSDRFPDRARPVGDWDLCTDAEPKKVARLFKKVIATGIAHGTVTVVLKGAHYEVTTLRGEKGHSDGRRPDEVFFVHDLEEDLARRDFTVNAMAFDVLCREFFDPFSGLLDLEGKKLRAVGAPDRRFAEDGLRVLRLARFCATLEFEIEDETRQAMTPSLASFEKVAQERVRDEWFKALRSRRPSRFLDVIQQEKILHVTAPSLTNNQALFTAERLDKVDRCSPDPILRLALIALLFSEEPGESTARFLATRLRLSRHEGARLLHLCAVVPIPDELRAQPTPARARRYLATVGRDAFPDVKQLQGLAEPSSSADELLRIHDIVETEHASGAALSLKELAVSGGELMREAGIEKGPVIGQTLDTLLQHVLEDPALNERDRLLSLARQIAQNRPNAPN